MDFEPFYANADDPTLPPGQCDVILVAENRRIYVNRVTLAMHSPIFKRLIYEKYPLPKAGEISLKEDTKFKVVSAAMNLLKLSPDFSSINCALIIRQEEFITNANVGDLLEFADEYRLDKVARFCEAFLMDTWGIFKPENFKAFLLSHKFGFVDVAIGREASDFITDDNLEQILSVAIEYRVSRVVALCEKYLLNFWKAEPDMIVHAVELAAKYNLQGTLSTLLKYGKYDASPITTDADLEQILNLAKKYTIPQIVADCEQYILQTWISRGDKAIRAVEVACEMNLPKLAIEFIPLAANRPQAEVFASTAWSHIVNPTHLKTLRRLNGLSSETKSINDLPDDMLSELFSYLPPNDRLHLSEVCSRFYDVSRKEWLDVTYLGFAQIPSPNIGAVLRQSPNVESIFAMGRRLILDDLLNHSLINVTSVKLYDVQLASGAVVEHAVFENYCPRLMQRERQNIGRFGPLLSQYFENFPQLDELILHNVSLQDLRGRLFSYVIPLSFPQTMRYSLTKLQIGVTKGPFRFDSGMLSRSLALLTHLECLSLNVRLLVENDSLAHIRSVETAFGDALRALQNLRELSLDVRICTRNLSFESSISVTDSAIASLPKLEILFLCDVLFPIGAMALLIIRHATLRILLITGVIDEDVHLLHHIGYRVDIAPRKRFPNAFGAEPLPTLHVFVGRHASSDLGFRISAEGASQIHPIDKTMPALLADEEIAEVFAGSWLAEKILEGAEFDADLFWYHHAITPSVFTIVVPEDQG